MTLTRENAYFSNDEYRNSESCNSLLMKEIEISSHFLLFCVSIVDMVPSKVKEYKMKSLSNSF